MAGHSKWSNIQHRKGRQDSVRSKLFSKLSKEITVAAKMGEPDPDKNPRLRLAIKEAKVNSVPKDVIERAIKKSEIGSLESYEEIRYEGYGVNGVALVIEAVTDNKNRTASNVRSIFAKSGGSLGETGSVSFMFDRLGQIIYSVKECDSDSILDAAIDVGADDVVSDDDFHTVYCKSDKLHAVLGGLESLFGEASSGKLIWRPQVLIELDVEAAKSTIKLIESLENNDDIQSVTANCLISQGTINEF